jgi:hypothetical protein
MKYKYKNKFLSINIKLNKQTEKQIQKNKKRVD